MNISIQKIAMTNKIRKKYKIGIRQRFTIVFSLFLFILGTANTINNIRTQEKVVKERLISEAKTIITILEASAAEYLNDLRIDQIREDLNFILTNDEIVYTYVFDKNNRLITDGTTLNKMRHKVFGDEISLNAYNSNEIIIQFTDNYLDVSAPVYLNIERTGTVRIGFSLNVLNAEIFKIRNENVISGMILLAIGIMLVNILINRITKPINLLTEGTKAVAEGVLNKKIEIKTSDELESLADAFNQMTTKIQETRQGIIKAKEQAEKSDKLKSEFLAQMSHEIRTPVNTIMNFTSLIRSDIEDQMNDEIKESFEIIDNGGRRLIRTIDLILNMSELQAGTYTPQYQQINLKDNIIAPLVNEFKIHAEKKDLSLTFSNGIHHPNITGDKYTLLQLFANLLDNAIKYTHQGGINVFLEEAVSNKFRVSIADTGIGISEKYIDNLFQPFSQEEQGYTRKFEGNGLGLALVKRYCELNNAEINVESEKGLGSVFSVIFNSR